MTRVLLADDHPIIQAAVEAMLRGSDYELISKASSGAEAIEALARHDPEMLILDVSMPEGSGLDVLRKMRTGGDDRPVVILTASMDQAGFAEALALKVDGVLLKTSDPALLLDCLDSVRNGEEWIDPQLQAEAEVSPEPAERSLLSPRERELVSLVRQSMRNRDIAERLGITEGTVKVYLHSIFEKTGVVNRTELAIRAAEWIG
ncbi:response regulator transcription factor [Sphingomonas sabuli]|uniref:Response regulator transcription factor n=1 Tax=Sphingomonas sabuli TaxID=2764186 RepID=A0A7G9L044_9SPHN|nr:response regulator transcription factor [Sphingomonas sabuli]QNM81993.1 response regulator transcription factor [Sphingomonas sabuli]